MLDLFLLWLAAVGVWPLANPDHSFDTAAGVIDIIIHLTAIAVLSLRWNVQFTRRNQQQGEMK